MWNLPFQWYNPTVIGVQSKEASYFSCDKRRHVHDSWNSWLLEDKKEFQYKGMSSKDVLARIDWIG